MSEGIRLSQQRIPVKEYIEFRKLAGWHEITEVQAEEAFEKDLFAVCAFEGERLVGFGRVIGDGNIYFYIQDILIHPDFQKRGIGKCIMNEIEAYLNKNTKRNSFVGLMAANGVTGFYEGFGYEPRSKDAPGMYRWVEEKE